MDMYVGDVILKATLMDNESVFDCFLQVKIPHMGVGNFFCTPLFSVILSYNKYPGFCVI